MAGQSVSAVFLWFRYQHPHVTDAAFSPSKKPSASLSTLVTLGPHEIAHSTCSSLLHLLPRQPHAFHRPMPVAGNRCGLDIIRLAQLSLVGLHHLEFSTCPFRKRQGS